MDNVGLFTPQQVLENRGRIAIFIDGSNLFYAALQLGIEIDYSKLLCYLTAGSRLLRAFFYTGVDPTNEKQQGFLLWMRRNGYRVVCKELVQLPDGSKKANLDVEIAVDMLSLVGSYDTAILVSGDGDLAYAVDAVSYRGVRVEVVSLRSMTSDNLINVADRYIDLETIRDEIRKANRPTPYRSVAEMVNNANNNANDSANPSRSN
ncbi:MAG: NYN domain-containing protein [Gloeomargarita sp. GMQP_bins_14]